MMGIMATNSQSSDRREGRRNSKVEDSPPPFSTWNRLYAAVVIYTLILVAALYWMTAALNR
jgi:polyferredoxin